MPEAIIAGKRVRFNETDAIGKGGEADVYDLGNGTVLKLWKKPDHPDLALDQAAQKAAISRITEQQTKLPALLKYAGRVPASVILPIDSAHDRSGKIVGYVMPFLSGMEVLMKFGQKSFRQNIPTDNVIAILRELHMAVQAVHQEKIVIGDFNDLNVLVGAGVHIIDADSMQFDPFHCMTYTTTFVAPWNCDPNADAPQLAKPHSADSDWYAFAVMVMQTLLFVGPYGGIHKPQGVPGQKTKEVPHNKRPLKRVTVFNPDVRYPKPAIPFSMLPDDLLHHLQQVFQNDARGVFPAALLDRLRWTKCAACGIEHGRSMCPNCSTVAPGAVKETTSVRGKVTATRIFPTGAQTRPRVLRAEIHNGKLMWLYHESGRLKREGGTDLGALGQPDPYMRFRLRANETFIGKGSVVVRLAAGFSPDQIPVDASGSFPVFDINDNHIFWSHEGVLYRDKNGGQERVGDILRGHTLLWVGPAFGFGFYRAGTLNVAFVFTASTNSLNDTVKLPPISGKLLDAACAFTKDRVWFFSTSQEGARTVNRCTVIRADGIVEGTAEAEQGDTSWLGKIRGAVATGSVLLMPTDEGVAQVKLDNGSIVESERFPDTEPFVDSDTKLLVGADGLYAVRQDEIFRLVIDRK